jgi:hypothetical protein
MGRGSAAKRSVAPVGQPSAPAELRMFDRGAVVPRTSVGWWRSERYEMPGDFNDFEVAARESATAFEQGKLWGFIRHARISEDRASEFWDRMAELVDEFDRIPRSGETMYGFAIGIYPTDHPTLPTAE